jgi:hypothetical protein
MTPQEALKQSNLTGTGTRDSLTLDLQDGQRVTLTREDVTTWPGPEHKRVSFIVIGGVLYELRFSLDFMQRARQYFDLVRG